MVSIFQAIIIGLVQGLTELFPISSLGHSVILPVILGWHIDQNASNYLTFLVATHLATAIALLVFFWRDWVKIVKGIFRSLFARRIDPADTYAKLGWLLVVGTIPAGLLGLMLQKELTKLFAAAEIASIFLMVNGIILYGAEKLHKRNLKEDSDVAHSDKRLSRKLGWWQSVGIGVVQSAALIPGISRSGASMAGGIFYGLNNEDAARFSFLLATPIIGAAALLKIPAMFTPAMASMRLAAVIGAIFAGITAYLSVKFLVKYFQTKTLYPFAAYCVLAGAAVTIFLIVR
jgi:undecaprenyl-diphosphatase